MRKIYIRSGVCVKKIPSLQQCEYTLYTDYVRLIYEIFLAKSVQCYHGFRLFLTILKKYTFLKKKVQLKSMKGKISKIPLKMHTKTEFLRVPYGDLVEPTRSSLLYPCARQKYGNQGTY